MACRLSSSRQTRNRHVEQASQSDNTMQTWRLPSVQVARGKSSSLRITKITNAQHLANAPSPESKKWRSVCRMSSCDDVQAGSHDRPRECNWIRERGAGQRAGGTADSRGSELHANHVQSTGCCGGKQTIRLPRGAAEAWPAPDKSQRLSFLVHRSGLLHCRRKKHSLSGALIRTDRTRNVKCPLGTIFRATSWPNCFSKRFWSF